jgi:hypothetical protein
MRELPEGPTVRFRVGGLYTLSFPEVTELECRLRHRAGGDVMSPVAVGIDQLIKEGAGSGGVTDLMPSEEAIPPSTVEEWFERVGRDLPQHVMDLRNASHAQAEPRN